MEFFFRNGLTPATQRSYNSAKRCYILFCNNHGLSPTPAALEHQLCQYVSYLAMDNLCHNTIKCYLSAVRHLHIAEGMRDPNISKMARLEQVLRGIKAVQARGKVKVRPRLPISIDILSKLRGVWLKEASLDAKMLWAASSLCFFGFFRSGELTVPSSTAYDEGAHLSFPDLSVDSLDEPQLLKVKVKSSKTDPFRVGVDIYIGRTGCSLCPVSAVLSYMTIRGPGPGPLFVFSDGTPLTRARFVERVKVALEMAGVDSSLYSGHSFRSGAATTAAERGIGDAMIKTLGRWKSSAYQVYIKTPREQLAGLAKVLSSDTSTNCR